MTRQEQKDVLRGIVNQLDNTSRKDILLTIITSILTTKERTSLIDLFSEEFKEEFLTSIQENNVSVPDL